MRIWRPSRINLRQLILMLSVCSTLALLVAGALGVYQAQREQLIADTLDTNEAFAQKLAATISDILRQAQQDLAYAAERMGRSGMDARVVQTELNRLREQGVSFNAASITDSNGIISTVVPKALQLEGRRASQPGPDVADRYRIATISRPFVSLLGNLAVQLTHPLQAPDGRYLGYVAGTFYLKAEGGLSRLISQQFFRNDTYVYVVDANRLMLYHPETERIGHPVKGNTVIDEVLQGRAGQQRLINSQGVDMLAGYAYAPLCKWGIVVQRPTAATLSRLSGLMRHVLWLTLAPAALLMIVLWMLSYWIARPLRELALLVQHGYEQGLARRVRSVRGWYFEAQQLKRALLAALDMVEARMGQLRDEAYVDALSGLGNRRGLNAALLACKVAGRPFSVMVLDIDFFKRINDQYGHDVGDRVIQQVAQLMRSQAREADALFRMGGEEFLVLLPGTNLAAGLLVAERVRTMVEQAELLPGDVVTVSIGVAPWCEGDSALTLKAADEALYRAKTSGRNRVMAAPDCSQGAAPQA